MKQHAFFFGVAYALSIGSVLLLGGRKDGLSLAKTSSMSPTENVTTPAAASDICHDAIAALPLVPEFTPEPRKRSQSDFAMAHLQHPLEVFTEKNEAVADVLLLSPKSGNPGSPTAQVDAVETSIAFSDSFDVDDDIRAIESPSKAAATPTEALDEELNALAPTELADDDAVKLAELRETMATLTKAKAELLNAKALEGEIAKLQKQIIDLQAARRLHDAHQALEKLIREFPDSPAATRAKSMLNALPASRTSRERLTPIPDPRFLAPKGA